MISSRGVEILCSATPFVDTEELQCAQDVRNDSLSLLAQAESRFNLRVIDLAQCSQVTDEGL